MLFKPVQHPPFLYLYYLSQMLIINYISYNLLTTLIVVIINRKYNYWTEKLSRLHFWDIDNTALQE